MAKIELDDADKAAVTAAIADLEELQGELPKLRTAGLNVDAQETTITASLGRLKGIHRAFWPGG